MGCAVSAPVEDAAGFGWEKNDLLVSGGDDGLAIAIDNVDVDIARDGCRLGWTAMISEKAQRSQFLLFLRKNRQTESCVGHFSEGTGTPEPSFRFSVMGGRQQIRIAVA